MRKRPASRAKKKAAANQPLKIQQRATSSVKLQDGRPVKLATATTPRPPARKMAQVKSKPAGQKKRKVIGIASTKEDDSIREQLYNGGATGTAKQISTLVDQITSIRGMMLDTDLKHFKKSPVMPTVPSSPKELYEKYVAPWLKNHPTLSKAQVRNSGNGLHVLLMLDKPIELQLDHEREYWDGRIRLIQCALPSDPESPGINATTRPVGEINKKNGATVTLLCEGQPVTKQELEELAAQVFAAPFKTLVTNVFASDEVWPCPVCNKPRTRMTALDERGTCYGGNHRVSYEQLVNAIMGEK